MGSTRYRCALRCHTEAIKVEGERDDRWFGRVGFFGG